MTKLTGKVAVVTGGNGGIGLVMAQGLAAAGAAVAIVGRNAAKSQAAAAALVSEGGRAIALTWRPIPMVLGAAVLMGLAVRFVHFALFGEPLNAPLTLAIETAILFAVALLAYRRTRARQMVQQYYWLYEASGPLGWRPRQDKPQATV